jgi:hypothetical protein
MNSFIERFKLELLPFILATKDAHKWRNYSVSYFLAIAEYTYVFEVYGNFVKENRFSGIVRVFSTATPVCCSNGFTAWCWVDVQGSVVKVDKFQDHPHEPKSCLKRIDDCLGRIYDSL